MDLNRRVSSAGYRLQERNINTRLKSSQPAADRSRQTKGDTVSNTAETEDKKDTVKQDRLWTELMLGERRGLREWEKNWGFLKNYDQMGQLKPEEPLPSNISLFSDRVPNTSNQMFGSRLSTPLGKELVRLDRLLLWSAGNRRRKLGPEKLAC